MDRPAQDTPTGRHLPITYRGTVYPSQCDHMGHMNVMWYVGKFDEASWQFFATIGFTPSRLRAEGRGLAAVEQHIEYKRELHAGDIVTVRTELLEVRDKAIRFVHEMRNDDTGEIAATTVLVGVHLDMTSRRACRLPADVLERAILRMAEGGNTSGASSASRVVRRDFAGLTEEGWHLPPSRPCCARPPSLVVSERWNSGREPHAPGVANQQHRAGTVRRHGIQRVVDSKVAVQLERHGRVVLCSTKGAAASQNRVAKTLTCRSDRCCCRWPGASRAL